MLGTRITGKNKMRAHQSHKHRMQIETAAYHMISNELKSKT